MRFSEAMDDSREKETKAEKKEKEEPRVLAGSSSYDYAELGRLKPLKGGNPYGS